MTIIVLLSLGSGERMESAAEEEQDEGTEQDEQTVKGAKDTRKSK
jgi:hypothetical protein